MHKPSTVPFVCLSEPQNNARSSKSQINDRPSGGTGELAYWTELGLEMEVHHAMPYGR
jgi:hypothetical protein